MMGLLTKNVCKACGKSGLFLKLDSRFLCEECVRAEKSRMTADAVADDLASMVTGKGNAAKVRQYLRESQAQNRRARVSFEAVYNQYQRARQLEKEGKAEQALKLYLKLLENCPPGTDYYVRPCILLEKQGEYAQAIEICDLAVQNIRQGRFQADETEFLRRRQRLERKLSK